MPLYMPPEDFSSTNQGSMRDPPHDAFIRPTGTLSSFCKRTPKWYSTAEKLPIVLGEQTVHCVLTSLAGALFCTSGTLKRRTFGRSAVAVYSLASWDWLIDHCMLDCPEPSQTSPM